jgi:hypothetical protein
MMSSSYDFGDTLVTPKSDLGVKLNNLLFFARLKLRFFILKFHNGGT